MRRTMIVGLAIALAMLLGVSLDSVTRASALETVLGEDESVIVEMVRPGGPCASPNADSLASALHGWKIVTPITYYVATQSIPKGMTQQQFVGAISAGAGVWNTAAGAGLLNFGGTVVGDKEGTFNGVSSVKHGGTVPSGAIAVAWVRHPDGVVTEVDIRLGKSFGYAINATGTGDCDGANSKMDLQDVMAHEFGHGVGAAHTPDASVNNAQTMFPFISYKELFKRDLANGDKASVSAIYP